MIVALLHDPPFGAVMRWLPKSRREFTSAICVVGIEQILLVMTVAMEFMVRPLFNDR
ncbi:MAG: hypothetical protein MK165_05385 [Pirellulaceae bacterium]|nr:hypothetical protein [Pirellulaceae bacterium]